jgi:serine/threonine-protein kinase
VIVVLALGSLLGCTSESTLVLRSWQLDVAGEAGASSAQVTLPVHLDDRLPAQRSRYALRTSVALPPALQGRALTLAIPHLDAPCTLLANGRPMAPLDVGTTQEYRGQGHPRWTIPAELSAAAPTLDLELDVEHTWTQSGWLDTPPRLSATPEGDSAYLAATQTTDRCAIGALAGLGFALPLYLLMFVSDRRRVAFGWWALATLTSMPYPAFLLGLTPRVFGIYDTPVMSVSVCVTLWACVRFTHEVLGLPRPHAAWNLPPLGCLVTAVLFGGPFWSTRVVTPFTIVAVVAGIAYQLYVPVRRWSAERRIQSLVMLLGWGALGVIGVVDYVAWAGFGELAGGARAACAGIALLAICQALVLSGDHVASLRRADRLNLELARQVEALQARNREVGILNAELRRQVAARSEHLAQALSRLTATEGAAPRALEVGEMVDARYHVKGVSGRGGMSVVYEVERVSDGCRLALKLLANPGTIDLARFAREAQIISRLDHPNIVSIVDVDVAGSGFLYLVMEYVEGRSLDRHQSRFRDRRWGLAVLRQVAEGLAAIHAHGVVHRDLKPGNVLVEGGGDGTSPRVKIADFGVSRLAVEGRGAPRSVPPPAPSGSAPPPVESGVHAHARDSAAGGNLTEAGALVGTPKYMAPELVGEARLAKPPSDVFSFGVIAYEVLTGALPFRTPAAMSRMNKSAIPPPTPLVVPGLDPDIAALIEQCVAENPEDRPSTDRITEALARTVELVA